MNITGNASEHCQGVVTDAASAQLAPLDEARKINYWPRRIAKIEEALSNARALRRAARMQLLQADNPGTPPASGESLYTNACETVAQLEHEIEEAHGAIFGGDSLRFSLHFPPTPLFPRSPPSRLYHLSSPKRLYLDRTLSQRSGQDDRKCPPGPRERQKQMPPARFTRPRGTRERLFLNQVSFRLPIVLCGDHPASMTARLHRASFQ